MPDSYDERGATLVETTITVIPFFLIVLGIVQLALHGFTLIALQHSLAYAAREGSLTAGAGASARVSQMVAEAQTRSQFAIDISNVSYRVCPLLNPGCSGGDPAGSNQYLIIIASKPVPLFWGVGTINLTAKAIAKNEPV